MSTEQMRAAVAAVYPHWKAIKTMKDEQVLAIFRSLQARKKVK
jgi:hypothetical protein